MSADGELIFSETGMTARDELRVSSFGILRCPSCGELAAELLGRHNLIFSLGDTLVSREIGWGHQALLLSRGTPWCECRDGQRTELGDYDSIVAASNIALADAVWFAETEAYQGWPAGFFSAVNPGG